MCEPSVAEREGHGVVFGTGAIDDGPYAFGELLIVTSKRDSNSKHNRIWILVWITYFRLGFRLDMDYINVVRVWVPKPLGSNSSTNYCHPYKRNNLCNIYWIFTYTCPSNFSFAPHVFSFPLLVFYMMSAL